MNFYYPIILIEENSVISNYTHKNLSTMLKGAFFAAMSLYLLVKFFVNKFKTGTKK